jgi:hypothetical protein
MLLAIRNFFWLCSGVQIERLKNLPSDHVKYASIGATVFFTGLLAAISGGYAIYSVFENLLITIPIAILWGLVIFNLDRYIVSSLVKPKSTSKTSIVYYAKEILPILPRLMLAGIIAVVIANPLELRLFRKEINQQISENIEAFKVEFSKNSSFIKQIEKVEFGLKTSKVALDFAKTQAAIIAYQNDYVKEVQGLKGTTKYGYGIAAKTLHQTILELSVQKDSLAKRYMALQKSSNKTIDSLQIEQKKAFSEALSLRATAPGFLAQNIALSQLQNQSKTVTFTSWFLKLLFFVIEISPILVKTLSPKSLYDLTLEKELETEKTSTLIHNNKLETNELENFYLNKVQLQQLEHNYYENKIWQRSNMQQILEKYLYKKLEINQQLGEKILKDERFSKTEIEQKFDKFYNKSVSNILSELDDTDFLKNLKNTTAKYY